MNGKTGVHNEAGDGVTGSVVQAGSIQHVSLTGAGHGDPGRAGSPPRQLPLAIRDFTGRAEYVTALDALLPAHDESGGSSAVVISAVDGAAGIGKTTLAVWWGHRVRDRFPDGTLYFNLRGYGPGTPANVSEVLESFLRGLEVPAGAIPNDVEARAALLRSLLAGRRLLMVLDNAEGADQVRPLLPGTPGCAVLVTSRDSLTGLVVTEGAHRLTLDLLTASEADELVRGIIGPVRAAAEPGAVADLIRLCARLPLALRIAATRATGPHATVADVVADLANDRYRLDALSWGRDEKAAVRRVFDWSYRRLSPEQARLLRRLSLHPGPEIGLHVAAAIADQDLGLTRRQLDTLAEAHLIEPAGRARYRFHDLLHDYAVERARGDPAAERNHTRNRVLRWYAWHAITAYQVLHPAHASWNPALNAATRTTPEITFTGPERAWAWLDTESVNLVAATRSADQQNLHQFTALLSHTTGITLFWRRDWDTLLDNHQRGLDAARRGGDRIVETHALLNLGAVYRANGRWRDATEMYLEALHLARALGNPWLEANALNDHGVLYLDQKRYTRARECLRAALPLSTGAQNGRLESVIEGNLSTAYTGMGKYELALRHAERALPLRQQLGDHGGEATSLHQIAKARQGMEQHREAVALCEQALAIESHQRYPPETAVILETLGTSLRHLGDIGGALGCWRDALAIYDKFSDHHAPALRERLRTLREVRH
ncbi:ATP-binding protein [Amycolatopsis anabasis]|uniref:ATP-binding protein n=1 Tax=Amycolatopsis anabasis TaxID=1840409 RepID=UPI00131D4A35|nr:tetratricopeptide repeat protein [Amycolatopsis anabasis]